MRILLVVPQDEETGGVASVVRNLAKSLISKGHQVSFFHPTKTIWMKRRTTTNGFPGFELRLQMPLGDRHPVISLLVFLFRFPLAMCQLIFIIRWHKIDVINIHYPAENFFYFALCRQFLSFSLVTSIHGADVFPNGSLKRPSSRSFSSVLHASDAVVAPSRRFRQDFLAAYPELDGTTTFIHNGLNLAEINHHMRGGTRAYPNRYILCISAYKQQKAIDVLLRAFEQVYQLEPSVKLVLVGSGPLFHAMEDLATALGIRHQVEFLGRQNHAEAMKLLRDCEVFVLPSRFETFGIVILEAMACNKPVIATKAGGIPEIIEDGKNGVLVPPDDAKALANALIAIMNDRNFRTAIASNGHKTVHEQYGSEKNGAAYEALFLSLVKPLRAA